MPERSAASDALEEVRIYLSWVPPNHADAAFRALGVIEAEIKRLEANQRTGRIIHGDA